MWHNEDWASPTTYFQPYQCCTSFSMTPCAGAPLFRNPNVLLRPENLPEAIKFIRDLMDDGVQSMPELKVKVEESDATSLWRSVAHHLLHYHTQRLQTEASAGSIFRCALLSRCMMHLVAVTTQP